MVDLVIVGLGISAAITVLLALLMWILPMPKVAGVTPKAESRAGCGLTPSESAALELTAELFNQLARLDNQHPWEQQEHMHDIHNIQHRIMMRVAVRAEPHRYSPRGYGDGGGSDG